MRCGESPSGHDRLDTLFSHVRQTSGSTSSIRHSAHTDRTHSQYSHDRLWSNAESPTRLSTQRSRFSIPLVKRSKVAGHIITFVYLHNARLFAPKIVSIIALTSLFVRVPATDQVEVAHCDKCGVAVQVYLLR
ncbi:Uncharacterized protein DAT39_015409 [Clarias magur]|uniref:Uncharacterized protein n=1 Tax=Clarias magur TaxID=1594786 RepID=A0A8J4XCD5_CLAMG|nr:Uncharacterized protein DAT39_015409 [Clarias magur]